MHDGRLKTAKKEENVCSEDSEFYEELTDITMDIQNISSDLTAMGATHADCILFDEYDEEGNLVE